MNDEWISVEKELPDIGQRVEVQGLYTREGYFPPISYRRQATMWERTSSRADSEWKWESVQWSGTCAITHWRPIMSAKEVEEERKKHDTNKSNKALPA